MNEDEDRKARRAAAIQRCKNEGNELLIEGIELVGDLTLLGLGFIVELRNTLAGKSEGEP